MQIIKFTGLAFIDEGKLIPQDRTHLTPVTSIH